MASARRNLTGLNQYIQIKLPNPKVPYAAIVAVKGTYVGQLQLESRPLDGNWVDRADEDSGVAIDGTYSDDLEADAEGFAAAFIPATEDEVRVYFSGYTSGNAEVALTLVPDLD